MNIFPINSIVKLSSNHTTMVVRVISMWNDNHYFAGKILFSEYFPEIGQSYIDFLSHDYELLNEDESTTIQISLYNSNKFNSTQ